MSYPESYRYTKEHEWVRADGTEATVGITDHAQHELGDIVFVNLPKAGSSVKRGETFGSVESVKAVSDVYSPVTGEVTAANELLSQKPETLNSDPHGDGWLIKIKLTGPDEMNALMSAADYQTYIGTE
ncbi:MAG TPA: glycine cleavage system protein GcvH [Bryobacteraceae bacterium]|jgi:glycine cleavage system H protein|nr:glycine cleavage system protein GcvH [Bryobacteraceae bacterium]